MKNNHDLGQKNTLTLVYRAAKDIMLTRRQRSLHYETCGQNIIHRLLIRSTIVIRNPTGKFSSLANHLVAILIY